VKRSRPPMMIVVDGEPTICEELSLPELKALQKQHNIVLNDIAIRMNLLKYSSSVEYCQLITQLGEDGFKNRKPGRCYSAEPKTDVTSSSVRRANILLRLILECVLDV
jgi:hypothetical protein